MKAIKLSHGVIFVKKDGVTVKVMPNGEVGLSPILFESLEWDLRTENPSTWEYLLQSDILGLGKQTVEKINQVVDHFNKTLN